MPAPELTSTGPAGGLPPSANPGAAPPGFAPRAAGVEASEADFDTAIPDFEDGEPVLAGIPSDFEEIVRRHQAMVFSLAYHFLRDRGRAEEVAQDVFLSLHRHLDRMKSPAHTVFWLRKVASQRSIDAARRGRRWFHKSLEDSAEPAAQPASADLLREETVWRMVARLPEIPRMVVILRYQEDLGPAEIATALSLPLATVKSHLQRSLAVLREKLSGLLGADPLGETL